MNIKMNEAACMHAYAILAGVPVGAYVKDLAEWTAIPREAVRKRDLLGHVYETTGPNGETLTTGNLLKRSETRCGTYACAGGWLAIDYYYRNPKANKLYLDEVLDKVIEALIGEDEDVDEFDGFMVRGSCLFDSELPGYSYHASLYSPSDRIPEKINDKQVVLYRFLRFAGKGRREAWKQAKREGKQ